ncbi:methylamine utilization protein [Methylobacterium sp. J-048]|uniref:methylamine utilization protein n=1 Tax=Methylobacterium sp. J-048 TaxID=2836635 RepID=UPI001FBA9178|nr:methylamine utilization protein [Methylobacterium sp. J-048]MCJ2055114.1 methylamine utilization protein [Methylobacterium sp. J-048]
MTILLSFVGIAVAALPDAEHVISQKGRQFRPGAIGLHPGEHITVVNDAADLIHHAYIDASDLTYDSGDQDPGTSAVISFPKGGDFLVLCGIHPKMKLTVHVE